MSSRQLKKLRRQQELQDAQKPAETKPPIHDSDDSDDDDPEVGHPIPHLGVSSGFAALSQLGGDDDNGEEEADEEALPEGLVQVPEENAETAAAGKKKKKKKKKKGKKTVAAPEPDLGSEHEDEDGLDEIDRALEELKINDNQPSVPTALRSNRPIDPMGRWFSKNNAKNLKLFQVDTHHLKVMNEMRAVFGRETIEAVRADNNRESQPNPSRLEMDLEAFLAGGPAMMTSRQARRAAEVLAKRNPFAQVKDSWPQGTAGGLTMRLVKEDDGGAEFTFAHDKSYADMEAKFFRLVENLDQHQMIYFLKAHPYHVSSLVQTSDIAKGDRNSALATDLCERALYTFGRVTLSAFRKKLEEGKARVDFRRPENRQFWLAGYHYIMGLIPKGTYRTALEWTKLFLSISPQDEYAMMLFAHQLAIKAKLAQWYIDLWESDFFDAFPSPIHDYVRQTLVLARLQVEDEDGAIKALMEGIKAVPWLYASLFSDLGMDAPQSIWGIRPRNESEQLYTTLYLTTAKGLWNAPRAMTLLREVASIVPRPNLESLATPGPCPRSIARFVHLDGRAEFLRLLPEDMLNYKPNYGFDPVPPPQGDNIFSNTTQQLPWVEAEGRDMWESGDEESDEPATYNALVEAMRLPGTQPANPALASALNLINRMRGRGPGTGGVNMDAVNAENDDNDDSLPPLEEQGAPEDQ